MRYFEVKDTPCMLLVDQRADLAQLRRELMADAEKLQDPKSHPQRAAVHVTKGPQACYASGNGYTLDMPREVFPDAALHRAAVGEWVEV